MAETADPYELYETAVQNVEEQCSFIDHTFKLHRRRRAQSFREDFCGTASACCEWVRLGPARRAIGVDLDPVALEWGRAHRVSRLTEPRRRRVSLIRDDVLKVRTPSVDVIGAFNFSYWIFAQRPLLKNYFEKVYRGLVPEGLFFLDAFGGYDAFREMQEKMKFKGFTYIWDQARYSPVTGMMQTYIHFRFPDGSRLKKAFSYEWRLWTLPEIRELLAEAGFRSSSVYFEYRDDDGEALGEWYTDNKGSADAAWIANIVAEK